jgi:hypothetical protein
MNSVVVFASFLGVLMLPPAQAPTGIARVAKS